MADLPISEDNGQMPITINDPTTVLNSANVKGASTAAVAADNSLVVALSPNSPIPTGTNNIGNVGVAQGSTTSGELGPLVQGAVTTSAPTYTTGQTDPLSLTVAGALRVDGSAITQPISVASLPLPTGAATAANQASEIASLASIDLGIPAALGQTTMAASMPVTIASNQSAIPVTLTSTTITGTVAVTQSTSPWVSDITQWATMTLGFPSAYGTAPALGNVIGVNAFITNTPTVTANIGTNGGLALDSTLTSGSSKTQISSWLGSAAPTVGQKTMAASIPVVIASDQSAIPVSGTVTANQGTANTIANAWPVKITDGTDTVAINTDGSLNVKQNPANLSVTATAATGVAVTATLPAVAADFHYITMIEIIKYATAAITGSATPILVTTTNFPTANVFTFGTAQAVGATLSYVYAPALPIRSAVVNTATTIVCPATPSVIWRVNVYYYAGV